MLVGCDPEFYLLEAGAKTILNIRQGVPNLSGEDLLNIPFGADHGGAVLEIRPKPAGNTPQLLKNIKEIMTQDPIAKKLWDKTKFQWRAGAFLLTPPNADMRKTIGGHVHLDRVLVDRKQEVIERLTMLEAWFRTLGWLPARETAFRRRQLEDISRVAYDFDDGTIRLEFRLFPSWLYSQELTALVLGFSKAAVTRPRCWDRHLTGAAQVSKLQDMAKASWGERSLASEMLLKRDVLDNPDLDVPLQDVWGR